MTAKRFTIDNDKDFNNKVETYELNCISDNENQTFYFIADSIENVQLFVKRLNELHEENQSSKEFIEQLQEELVLFKKAGADMSNDLNAQITALKQENKHLQQKNKRLEEKIQRERASFTKTHERWSKEAETKIKELSEENEQLKQQLNRLNTINEVKRETIKFHVDGYNRLKQTILEAYETERTELGKSVLKQLLEQIQ